MGDSLAYTDRLCQQSCQKHPDCNWWSLDLVTWNRYGCWLKTKKDTENKDVKIGSVFGPKYCRKSRIMTYNLNEFHHKLNKLS